MTIKISTGRLLDEVEKQHLLAALRAKATLAERCGLSRTATWWRAAIQNMESRQQALSQGEGIASTPPA
jgi:hypothetical protein